MALPPHLADLEGRLASRVDEALAGFRRAFEARLREATERLLADATNVAAPHVAGLLAEAESEALDAAPRREGARSAVASLLIAARAFDRAATQADVLAALVAAGRASADRVALLLVRDDLLIAFEGSGFDRGPARGSELRFDGTLRERLYAARGCLALGAEAAAEVSEQIGWPAGGAAVVVPLVLRDRIAALLWADRAAAPPELAPLQLLTAAAAQRLELQALSIRGFTPTLYEGSEAPGAPLPLWISVPDRPAAPPSEPTPADEASAEPQLDAAEAFEIVGDESAALPLRSEPESQLVDEPPAADSPAGATSWSLAAEEAAPAPAIEEPIEAVADELWTGTVTAPFETPALESAADLAAEPPTEPEPAAGLLATAPTWELATLESAPPAALPAAPQTFELEAPTAAAESEALFEPVPEPAAPMAPMAPPPPTLSEENDLLRTMRMPLLGYPLVGEERRPEETTAPHQVEEVSTSGQGASTHEFPAPDLTPGAARPARPEPDLAEDETVLTRRLPVMPVVPPPSIAPAAPSLASPFGASIAAAFDAPAPAASDASITPIPAPTPLPLAPAAAVTPLAPASPDDPLDRTASRQRSTEVAPPPDLQGPGRAFLSARSQRTAAESPAHEEAKRLARLLISEIKLYNEEQVLEGRRNRDLYHRLKDDIDRSRQIYDERVDPAVRSGSDYFHQELVRSLAGGDPRALGI